MRRIRDDKGRERGRLGDDTSENEWRRKEMRGRTGIEGGKEVTKEEKSDKGKNMTGR